MSTKSTEIASVKRDKFIGYGHDTNAKEILIRDDNSPGAYTDVIDGRQYTRKKLKSRQFIRLTIP